MILVRSERKEATERERERSAKGRRESTDSREGTSDFVERDN